MILNRETMLVPVDELEPHPENPRRGDLESIRESIRVNGFYGACIVQSGTNRILAGEHRWRAAKLEGLTSVPVIFVQADDQTATRILLADNATNDLAGYDDERLAELLRQVSEEQEGLAGTGYTDERLKALLARVSYEQGAQAASGRNKLRERFVVPPFTILDSRQGYWQDRKSVWMSMGLRSEVGRSDGLTFTKGLQDNLGMNIPATSVFDPVLTELLVRWFSPVGGDVLDPFAGGSVRGVVTAMLGREYTGVDLNEKQIEANLKQWQDITGDTVEETTSNPTALTPVEKHGDIWLKRDDLYEVAGVKGGKVRACWMLAKKATNGLVTAGSRSSPQVNIVAHIGKALGIPVRCHTPEGKLLPEVEAARSAGAEIIQHRAGYNSVIVKRARDDADGLGWTEIPFGMECEEAIRLAAAQCANLPPGIKRLVVPVGSGMNLAGILHGIKDNGRDLPVVGVKVGAEPEPRLDKWAPEDWRDRVTLVESGYDYHEEAYGAVDQVILDPIYEAKCLPHVEPGDCLWIVGIRQTVKRPALEDARNALSVQEAASEPDASIDCPVVPPRWIAGDSVYLTSLAPGSYDMILSCPPYADLEVYTDKPNDISNMDEESFLEAYRRIIGSACSMLAEDRFACWVIGDVRDKKHGFLRGLVADTIRLFEEQGLKLYNEAILVTQMGSQPIRTSKAFPATRKMGKVHQNVLVFVKGDAAKAVAALGSQDLGPEKTRWKLSRQWTYERKLACTGELIGHMCKGACCRQKSFWPPNGGEADGRCDHLGQNGCVMGDDRPVTCHLYPLVLNKNGTLVMHARAKSSACGASYGYEDGPTVFESVRPSLVTLFGEDQVERAEKEMAEGRDPYFDVPDEVLASYELEMELEAEGRRAVGLSGEEYEPVS